MGTIRIWMGLLAAAALFVPALVWAAFDSGSTGADGALEVTQTTALQLPPDGVFNFTTVRVASGATLTFKKNEKNTPVTILATGDVLIEGTISVAGSAGGIQIANGKGGPGSFDGGIGGWHQQAGGRGQGPGGGAGGNPRLDDSYAGENGGGAGFNGTGAKGESSSLPGASGGSAYGNTRLIPMLGGSGGGGGGGTTTKRGGAGGGGGGGILIASSGTIQVTGAISANGGRGGTSEDSAGGDGGGGAGGSIRLVANLIAGDGPITARGNGGGAGAYGYGGTGANGHIRIETWNSARTSPTDPVATIQWYPYALYPVDLPSLTITSVGGIQVPMIQKGYFKSPDIILPPSARSPVTVSISANNIPTGTTVTVRSIPEFGNTIKSASGPLVGSNAESTASVQLEIASGHTSLLSVSATYNLTAALGTSFSVDGEKIARVRVNTELGGESQLVYITETGREIPATL